MFTFNDFCPLLIKVGKPINNHARRGGLCVSSLLAVDQSPWKVRGLFHDENLIQILVVYLAVGSDWMVMFLVEVGWSGRILVVV